MRSALSDALVSMASRNQRFILLTGDHGYALFDAFQSRFPTQFINAGVAEQNMVGMAAGLARVGFKPCVYGLAAFIPVRTLEQIKLDVAHEGLPVIFLGDGAGLVYSHLGSSHQSTEDIACLRAIPSIEILSPADRHEMSACMAYAENSEVPVYIRVGKADLGDVHAGPLAPLSVGGLVPLHEGREDRAALIATGSMVRVALHIGQSLGLSVWSSPFVKPLSDDDVTHAAQLSNGLIVLEEHSVLGGLGSAIAEVTSTHCPVRVLRVGIEDRFSEKCGDYSYLLTEHKIDHAGILRKVKDFCGIKAQK